jgi:hypothetical protein
MMKNYSRFLILTLVSLLILSCRFFDGLTDLISSQIQRFSEPPTSADIINTPTLGVSAPNESHIPPTDIPGPPQVILFDEFNDNTKNWEVGEFEGANVDITNGQMIIDVLTDNLWAYSILLDNIYDSVHLVVDVEVIDPAEDCNFGIICGFQDEGNFSALEIDPNGYYSIWGFDQNQYRKFIDWTYSELITRSGIYALSAYCGANRLALLVDDALIVETALPNYHSGKVGVIAGTSFSYPFKTAFDNFKILSP